MSAKGIHQDLNLNNTVEPFNSNDRCQAILGRAEQGCLVRDAWSLQIRGYR
jgi:hypothetical protein